MENRNSEEEIEFGDAIGSLETYSLDDVVFEEAAERIGFELKHARLAMELIQEQVAESAGISRGTIISIENGDIGDCGLLMLMNLAMNLDKALSVTSECSIYTQDDAQINGGTATYEMQNIKDIGEAIKVARKEANLTLKELEEKCHIDSAKLSRLESGKILHDIRLNTVLKVLENVGLRMSVKDFKRGYTMEEAIAGTEADLKRTQAEDFSIPDGLTMRI